MIRKILLGFFAALLSGPFQSYAQNTPYFSDRLIIKYESDQKLQQIRSKQNVNPRQAVEALLYKNGLRQSRPILSERLRQSIQQKRLPSTDDVLRIEEAFFSGNIDPVLLAAKINRMPGVAYAEPRYIREMNVTPNDPELEKFIDAHNFRNAWNLSLGSSDITIAIVDGGVGYTHPDLDDKLWVNQDEVPALIKNQVDQNSDGRVTSTEIKQYLQQNGQDHNGDGSITLQDALDDNSSFTDNLDNDNNNFTDDLFGWDFWASGSGGDITSDNDPFHDGTDHGSHVAGIAAAETDNASGTAAAGFNSNYMAVKVGGTPTDPNAIGFGFEGILYAAEEGAQVINCSWSGGSSSQAEEDVINLATEMGALVVAASGNQTSQVKFPARYDKVLAVGSVEPELTMAQYSNFGFSLDVLATGSDILSTSFNGQFISKTGTSMSTPVVSGLAALIKDIHPSWSAERIGMQIRASATNIDGDNVEQLRNKLGHGSIEAFRALNTNLPGLKTVTTSFVNTEGEKLALGESGFVEATITNVGNTSSSLTAELQSLNEGGVDIDNASQPLGAIATGDTVSVSFGITISEDFDLTEIPAFKVIFTDPNQNYDDFNVVEYDKLFFEIIAGNNVKTSFGAEGTIGFSNPLAGRGGVGFIPRSPDGTGGYREGDNLLFEGGLIMEVDGKLFDAVRSQDGGLSRDFLPVQAVTVKENQNEDGLIGSTQFVTLTDTARRAIIDVETFAFDDPEISNVVFLKYIIENPSEFITMENIRAGVFNDWDIGNPNNNSVTYSPADSILYLSSSSTLSTQPLVAIAHMGPISSALAIDNTIEGRTDSVTFGLYDGFTDAEKRSSLTAGTVRTSVENTDASAVVASGPYTLNPRAKVTVGFIYAFGNDLDELRSQINEARSRKLFEVSPTGRAVSEVIPEQNRLFQNYPNPFEKRTQIHIDLQESSDVKLTIYDVLGRKIQVLADEQFEAGSHFLSFDPDKLNLSSGIYFAHLETDDGTRTIAMSFIKPF